MNRDPLKNPEHITLYDLEDSDSAGLPEVARKLRDALGGFTTGVTIVTSLAPGGHWAGLTVNSFSSLSLDPPLILWCLTLESGLVNSFKPGEKFNLNILGEDQEELALKFARPSQDRFEDVAAHPDRDGVPLLENCSGILNCVVEKTYPGGDHIIIVAKVVRYRETDKPPLLFHKGRFKTF